MTDKILLVDDDENILHGYHRVLRSQFELDVALGGRQALQALAEHGPYAVLVADMKMPGMSGLEVLAEAQQRVPETIRIMLTGNADQKTAVDAVNEGRVFRFLTKPCPAEELALALHAGIRQHQLERAEKELLEQTLTGAVQVLAELLGAVDPASFSRCQALRRRCAEVGRSLACADLWALEIAALLAPIGRVTLPPEVRAGDPVQPANQALLERVPEVGARLLQAIPRLDPVARIIRYQAKGYDGSGFPADAVAGAELPLGARILKAVADFSAGEGRRHSRQVALEELRLHPKPYDPAVLEALARVVLQTPEPAPAIRTLAVAQLRAGMILAAEVRTRQGRLVCGADLCLGEGHLELLRNLAEFQDLQEPLAVYRD